MRRHVGGLLEMDVGDLRSRKRADGPDGRVAGWWVAAESEESGRWERVYRVVVWEGEQRIFEELRHVGHERDGTRFGLPLKRVSWAEPGVIALDYSGAEGPELVRVV